MIPSVGLNINSKIIADTEVDIAIGSENKVSYIGDVFLFFAAIIARQNARPTENGTVKTVNFKELKMAFTKLELCNTLT